MKGKEFTEQPLASQEGLHTMEFIR